MAANGDSNIFAALTTALELWRIHLRTHANSIGGKYALYFYHTGNQTSQLDFLGHKYIPPEELYGENEECYRSGPIAFADTIEALLPPPKYLMTFCLLGITTGIFPSDVRSPIVVDCTKVWPRKSANLIRVRHPWRFQKQTKKWIPWRKVQNEVDFQDINQVTAMFLDSVVPLDEVSTIYNTETERLEYLLQLQSKVLHPSETTKKEIEEIRKLLDTLTTCSDELLGYLRSIRRG